MHETIAKISSDAVAVIEAAFQKNGDLLAGAAAEICACLRRGGKVILFGNGGSAADAQHVAAELIGRFQKQRQSLAAVALTTDTSALTAIANDYGFQKVFARQLEGLGRPEDLVIAISTSGQSPNCIEAVEQARKMGIKTIALTGRDGGRLGALADLSLGVPSQVTARIQEAHICLAHCLCELVEMNFS